MVDASNNIWVSGITEECEVEVWLEPGEGGTQYTRTDLYDAVVAERDALRAALLQARGELEDVTEEFMGEDYNSPSMNAALEASTPPLGGE